MAACVVLNLLDSTDYLQEVTKVRVYSILVREQQINLLKYQANSNGNSAESAFKTHDDRRVKDGHKCLHAYLQGK